jgi:hypothetical protein
LLHEAGIREFFKKLFGPKKEKKDKGASAVPASTKTETPAATETTPVAEPTPATAPATAEPTSTADAPADGGEAKRTEADATEGGADGELATWVRFIRRFSDSHAEAVPVTDSSATAEAPKAAEPVAAADVPATTIEPTATAPMAEGMTATSGPLEDAPSAEASKED